MSDDRESVFWDVLLFVLLLLGIVLAHKRKDEDF